MFILQKNHQLTKVIKMKFAFVTCVQIGLSCMEAIYEAKGSLNLIISIPDEKAKKKSGRIYVDDFASKHNIPVIKSNHVNDQDVIQAIKDFDIDWLFIIGWSQIASKELIETPNIGVVGAHPTLLPVGRGRAAIPWAILKGLEKTGVTFFKMNEGVDTGLILGQEEIPISKNETATTLYSKVNKAHEVHIKKLYLNLLKGNAIGVKQDETKATYWEGRKPEQGEISLNMTMEQVDKLVRATTHPYPGAFYIKGSKKIIIWSGITESSRMKKEGVFELELADGFFYANKFDIIN